MKHQLTTLQNGSRTCAMKGNQPMNTCINNLFLLPVLLAGLSLMLAGRVTAQTFTTLYSFTGGSGGSWPSPGVIVSGNTLYGTAGETIFVSVFAVNTDGTGFTNLYTGGLGICTQCGDSLSGLILSGDTLYGTAGQGWEDMGGGSSSFEVFAVNTDGTGFTNLYSFTGGSTSAGLILSGSTLYGTADYLGGTGVVFAVNTNGAGFTNLYSFTATDPATGTNSDGANPEAGLILSGNTLYGTAYSGGSSGNGTVFAVNTDGTGFTVLHTFTETSAYTNSDGAYPFAGLISSGNTLYGTAQFGGSSGNGTVFAVNSDGTGFTTLHSFSGGREELLRMPVWFYRATPCMGRRILAAFTAMARCSPSAPMAPVLRPCTLSQQALVLGPILSTATEPIPRPV